MHQYYRTWNEKWHHCMCCTCLNDDADWEGFEGRHQWPCYPFDDAQVLMFVLTDEWLPAL